LAAEGEAALRFAAAALGGLLWSGPDEVGDPGAGLESIGPPDGLLGEEGILGAAVVAAGFGLGFGADLVRGFVT